MSNNHNVENDNNSETSDISKSEKIFASSTGVKISTAESILNKLKTKGIRLQSGLFKKKSENLSKKTKDYLPAERFICSKQIGKGGMSSIYQVFDQDIGRFVAVKLMNFAVDNQASTNRILKEMQLTGQLEHPNIVPLHDVGLDTKGNLFFSMKLVKGENLAEIIDHLRKSKRYKNFNRRRLLDIFIKICDAVAFAHSKKVIHRDLKPHNVMIGEFGEVLVMDWGLAKIIQKKQNPFASTSKKLSASDLTTNEAKIDEIVPEVDLHAETIDLPLPPEKNSDISDLDIEQDLGIENIQKNKNQSNSTVAMPYPEKESEVDSSEFSDGSDFLTKEGTIAGTPIYMSPEQARGEIDNIDEKSDIYSLGAILFQLMTYYPAVSGNPYEVVNKVAKGEISKPSEYVADLPAELESIILKAMSFRKGARYNSVKQFKEEILAFLEDRPIERISYTFYERFRKYLKRNRISLLSILIVIAATSMIFLYLLANEQVKAGEKEFAARETGYNQALKENEDAKQNKIKQILADIKTQEEYYDELRKVNNELKDYDQFNSFGLPDTVDYWKKYFKRMQLYKIIHEMMLRLKSEENFIIKNSASNPELLRAWQYIVLFDEYPGNFDTFKKHFRNKKKIIFDRTSIAARHLDSRAFANFSVQTIAGKKITELNLRLYKIEIGMKYFYGPRKIPFPYNPKKGIVAFENLGNTYFSKPKFIEQMVSRNKDFNVVKHDQLHQLVEGEYILRMFVSYLKIPVYLGFTVAMMDNIDIKVIIPDENFDNPEFRLVPGYEIVKNNKKKTAQPFYITANEIRFEQYLQFLNENSENMKYSQPPYRFIPRKNPFSLLCKFDETEKKFLLPEEISPELPVTGIDIYDAQAYVDWLNSKMTQGEKKIGEYRLVWFNDWARLNPYDWKYIWGDFDFDMFRLKGEMIPFKNNEKRFFADTNINNIHGLCSNAREFVMPGRRKTKENAENPDSLTEIPERKEKSDLPYIFAVGETGKSADAKDSEFMHYEKIPPYTTAPDLSFRVIFHPK